MKKILLYAYGNPGRGDDGLGNAFIQEMDRWIAETNRQAIDTDSNYQLNIEDASVIAGYDMVIFIDASKGDINDYHFDQIRPHASQTFTTHSILPSSLLALCNELYNRTPLVYLLQIKGYQWEFGEGLSPNASQNLKNALLFVQTTIDGYQ